MIIEQIDMFYLTMPEVLDIGDGSQDALLVRARGGGLTGWGECEASPLVSIANWICPKSHSACKNVHDSVRGQQIDRPEDIVRLGHMVRAAGLDIAQTNHTWSGVEIALWDLLGKQLNEPVYRLLGYQRAYPKTPYASQLFGDTPEQTLQKAAKCRANGFLAIKFGWGVYGRATVDADAAQVAAARDGLGDDGILLIDAGTVWGEDVEQAAKRLAALEKHKVVWFEEPFVGDATHAYSALANQCRNVRLAGGEGAFNFHMARNLIDHGNIGFVQIDTGRIGGIAPAKQVADYATQKGVTYVNHTFTTYLALAASLSPYAGIESASICEYPVEASPLAQSLTNERLEIVNGQVNLPDEPGLGISVSEEAIREYLVDVEIKVAGEVLYSTPSV